MKKFLAILMVVMLAVTISFVGCKAATTAETTAAGAETTAAATTAAGAETTAAATTAAGAETTAAAGEVKPFTLDDIPEIKNKAPLNTMFESGTMFDEMVPVFKAFAEKTGVQVNIERIATPVMYTKENVELVAGTGVYDLPMVETAWTDEWAQYLIPLEELAAKYESVEALNASLVTQAPAILTTCKTDGKLLCIPLYTYQCSMILRQDIFDDPTEQAAFKAKYGYDLKPATTPQQLYDQEVFFTRKKGEMLKGKPLTKDLYGMSIMAGAYQANDEMSTYLWGNGGDYVDVIKDDSGKVIEYQITKKNNDLMIQTMTEFRERVKIASPGCLTANFDFVVGSLGEGTSVIAGHLYANCFKWATDVLKTGAGVEDPDARLGIYPTIGAVAPRPYTGGYAFAVSKETKNEEAAYWLIRWIGSYEAQKAVMTAAGQLSTRLDVISDPIWTTPENTYPFAPLVDYLKFVYTNKDYEQFLDKEYYFNSATAGKVTEMHMNTLSKGFSGELSPEDCIASVNKQMMDLVTNFDTVPIVDKSNE
jgi:multiple sugar transport system substrate-binding protein